MKKIVWGLLLLVSSSRIGFTEQAEKKTLIESGKFVQVYDQSIGESQQWYINDPCFIKSDEGKWHLFGITHAEPANPIDEDNFAHATADSPLQLPWKNSPLR